MKKQLYNKKNGLKYTLQGDYYFPELTINEEKATYGKYGMMRKKYLKEHKSGYYQYLLLTGKLTEHLREQVEILVKQMAERQGVTEKMKEENQMEWVGRMNGIKASVEEIVFQQLIYI